MGISRSFNKLGHTWYAIIQTPSAYSKMLHTQIKKVNLAFDELKPGIFVKLNMLSEFILFKCMCLSIEVMEDKGGRRDQRLTFSTEVVILVPPDAPVTMTICPSSLNTMVGVMDESGLFPGTIKFAGDGGTPKEFSMPGVEKSSISLLKMIPVLLPRHFEPKLKLVENSNYRNCQPNAVSVVMPVFHRSCGKQCNGE